MKHGFYWLIVAVWEQLFASSGCNHDGLAMDQTSRSNPRLFFARASTGKMDVYHH